MATRSRPEFLTHQPWAGDGSITPDIFTVASPAHSGNGRDGHNMRAVVPWPLQGYFDGEIDLAEELSRRFPAMPLMSLLHIREAGAASRRSVATLSAQDRSSAMLMGVDGETRAAQLSFTMNSMLTFRFQLDELTDKERTRWLKQMKREGEEVAFLWSRARWRQDYLICLKRPYFTSFLAFSPHNFAAAVRATPDVTEQLLNWLESCWLPASPPRELSSATVQW